MTTTVPPEDEKIVVWHPDDMDRETFCLHMTHRHADSLGGMSELNPAAQSDYTETLWRLFHDKLHGPLLRREYDHEHEE
jgi:hypothetical protein